MMKPNGCGVSPPLPASQANHRPGTNSSEKVTVFSNEKRPARSRTGFASASPAIAMPRASHGPSGSCGVFCRARRAGQPGGGVGGGGGRGPRGGSKGGEGGTEGGRAEEEKAGGGKRRHPPRGGGQVLV